MKTPHRYAGILVASALCGAALTAGAGPQFRTGTYHASNGRSGAFAQTIHRDAGTYSRVTTGSQGRTATVDRTATHSGSTTTVDGTRTGFDGKTSSWNNTITDNGNGTASVSGQYTRQGGSTIDTVGTAAKTADGRTATGTYSASTGNSGNYSIDVVNADGTRTKTETITGADGKTSTRVITTDKDGNTLERTVATTGPGSRTETRSGSVTFNP